MQYLYRCNTCNHEFEKDIEPKKAKKQRRRPRVRCPKCGKSARKLINIPSVHFKGSGWGKDK